MNYSVIYTIVFSLQMSLSACLSLSNMSVKKNYSAAASFLMLFIPKTVFSLIRYYFENYEQNYILLIILILSMIIFDILMLFVIFDCPMIQKIIFIAMMDIMFLPMLLIKQAFESEFLTENNTLEFFRLSDIVIPLICYAAVMAIFVIFAKLLSRLLNKINFNKRVFNFFGILALLGYLSLELFSAISFTENLVGRSSQFIHYFYAIQTYSAAFLIMYLITVYFTKRRLQREIDILNKEKDREFRYYNTIKEHNEEIRKIKHDINGHFGVLYSLILDKEYTKAEEYITALSEDYKKIKRVVYTSHLMADAVITAAAEKCNRGSISFSCDGLLPKDCGIDDIAITCIFSNILDNAVEACEKTDGNKYIKISVFNRNNCIVISCINSKPENIKVKENNFMTTKSEPGHGFGLKIINEIVAEYDGVITIDDKGNEFELSLLIPQTEKVTKY